MSDYPMLISNKLHSFRNFLAAKIRKTPVITAFREELFAKRIQKTLK